ncbi:MAG: hypothetical protein VW266_05135 [Flavobacteriales bacterium]
MLQKKIISIPFLFSLSCAICSYFLVTLGINYPHSPPWNFVELMESLGFIAFVSKLPPWFFMVLGTVVLVGIALLSFQLSYQLQKFLLAKKIITPNFSAFALGALLSFMLTTTLFHYPMHRYYTQGRNDGKIEARKALFEVLAQTFPGDSVSCAAPLHVLLANKSMQTMQLVTINGVKTIRICEE